MRRVIEVNFLFGGNFHPSRSQTLTNVTSFVEDDYTYNMCLQCQRCDHTCDSIINKDDEDSEIIN